MHADSLAPKSAHPAGRGRQALPYLAFFSLHHRSLGFSQIAMQPHHACTGSLDIEPVSSLACHTGSCLRTDGRSLAGVRSSVKGLRRDTWPSSGCACWPKDHGACEWTDCRCAATPRQENHTLFADTLAATQGSTRLHFVPEQRWWSHLWWSMLFVPYKAT